MPKRNAAIGALSDKELVEYLKKGNSAAYEELVSRYSDKAFSLAKRLTRNNEDAEEVLQDVFVTVFRKIDGFEGKSSFSSWFYRITVNASFMKLRKRKQDKSVLLEDVPMQARQTRERSAILQNEGEQRTLRRQINQALEEAIERLPEDYRPVFVLRDVDGLSSAEVGKILNISIPAVKSRLHRSRLMLRRRLAAFYDEFTSPEEDGRKTANG